MIGITLHIHQNHGRGLLAFEAADAVEDTTEILSQPGIGRRRHALRRVSSRTTW
jgi:hypothetical protein